MNVSLRKTKNKLIVFNSIFVIATVFLILLSYGKFNGLKIDTLTFLFIIYRHINAAILKVGLTNTGNIFHISKNNLIELFYLFTTLIFIIPAWIGYLILHGDISIDVYNQYYIIWLLVGIAIIMDIFLYQIKKRIEHK